MQLHASTQLLQTAAQRVPGKQQAACLSNNLDALLRVTGGDPEIRNSDAVRQLVGALAQCFQPRESGGGGITVRCALQLPRAGRAVWLRVPAAAGA